MDNDFNKILSIISEHNIKSFSELQDYIYENEERNIYDMVCMQKKLYEIHFTKINKMQKSIEEMIEEKNIKSFSDLLENLKDDPKKQKYAVEHGIGFLLHINNQ